MNARDPFDLDGFVGVGVGIETTTAVIVTAGPHLVEGREGVGRYVFVANKVVEGVQVGVFHEAFDDSLGSHVQLFAHEVRLYAVDVAHAFSV